LIQIKGWTTEAGRVGAHGFDTKKETLFEIRQQIKATIQQVSVSYQMF
jgi:hypothetical protein